MALAQINVSITDADDPNADEQDILLGPEGVNPPTNAVLTNEPLTTNFHIDIGNVPGTYYAQRIVRNSATGEEAQTTPIPIVVEGPAVAWVTPSEDAILTEGNVATLAVDVTANSHSGVGAVGGIADVQFERSIDNGASYSLVGTAKCDDTTTPQASLDWTILGGTTDLRAVCVDANGDEVGTAATVPVSVISPGG